MPKLCEGYAARLRVPAGKRDIQVFDDALPGFGIRKFESGKASYFVNFNLGTQQRRLTLGAVLRGNFAECAKRRPRSSLRPNSGGTLSRRSAPRPVRAKRSASSSPFIYSSVK